VSQHRGADVTASCLDKEECSETDRIRLLKQAEAARAPDWTQ
jgi:hypothetical protein